MAVTDIKETTSQNAEAVTEKADEQEATEAAAEAAEPANSAQTAAAEEAAADAAEAVAVEDVSVLRDQLLRLAADFENFRKRTHKERMDHHKYGVSRLAQDVLDVMDNMERALAHAGESSQNPVVQGIQMVAKQLQEVMSRHGVVSFASEGEPFDPQKHEALGQMPSAEVAPGCVLSEISKGYMMHDRLLRPAKVMVAVAPPADVAEKQHCH